MKTQQECQEQVEAMVESFKSAALHPSFKDQFALSMLTTWTAQALYQIDLLQEDLDSYRSDLKR